MVRPRSTSPIGSGGPAAWRRRPAAIPSTRCGFRRAGPASPRGARGAGGVEVLGAGGQDLADMGQHGISGGVQRAVLRRGGPASPGCVRRPPRPAGGVMDLGTHIGPRHQGRQGPGLGVRARSSPQRIGLPTNRQVGAARPSSSRWPRRRRYGRARVHPSVSVHRVSEMVPAFASVVTSSPPPVTRATTACQKWAMPPCSYQTNQTSPRWWHGSSGGTAGGSWTASPLLNGAPTSAIGPTRVAADGNRVTLEPPGPACFQRVFAAAAAGLASVAVAATATATARMPRAASSSSLEGSARTCVRRLSPPVVINWPTRLCVVGSVNMDNSSP